MKIPAAAMKQIEQAVLSMMPYESDYENQTKQAKILNTVFQKIVSHEPDMNKWQGFLMYISKKIDNSPKLQKSIDAIISDLKQEFTDYEKRST
jgi:transcription termination factor NusB